MISKGELSAKQTDPGLKGRVYVQGPAFYESTCRVFSEAGYQITKDIRESAIVVLTGGADISPGIYGQETHHTTSFSENRDKVDLAAVEYGHKNGLFLAGICRGAQLLNCVPNEGTLWQDVSDHSGYHPVFDFKTKTLYPEIISVHHQQMIPGAGADIVAASNVGARRRSPGSMWTRETDDFDDIEVLWYPSTRSLCFQAHPEFGHQPSTDYFFHLLDRYYTN